MLSTPWCEKSENTKKRSATGARRNLPKGSVLSSEGGERLYSTVGGMQKKPSGVWVFPLPSCKIYSEGRVPLTLFGWKEKAEELSKTSILFSYF